MAKGKPYSDAEIRPETPEILRYLEKHHDRSPEWNADAGIEDRDRGLGVVYVDDGMADSVSQIEKIPTDSNRRI